MCIYIWKRNLYVILLIEVSSACFMLLGFHVFWSIIERNKEIKGWGEGKERKFWDKNIFFLLIHGIEFQQKMNKILALTNDDTIQLIINTWIHFLHVSRAFIILYLKCLQPHNKHYISWAPRNAWMNTKLPKQNKNSSSISTMSSAAISGSHNMLPIPWISRPSNYLPTCYKYNEQMLQLFFNHQQRSPFTIVPPLLMYFWNVPGINCSTVTNSFPSTFPKNTLLYTILENHQ